MSCHVISTDAAWLMVTCGHLHWTVQVRLAEVCAKCKYTLVWSCRVLGTK